jgi:hypothetical protein
MEVLIRIQRVSIVVEPAEQFYLKRKTSILINLGKDSLHSHGESEPMLIQGTSMSIYTSSSNSLSRSSINQTEIKHILETVALFLNLISITLFIICQLQLLKMICRGMECTSIFIDAALEWMGEMSETEGKLQCPKCSGKVGSWNWAGAQCSCG